MVAEDLKLVITAQTENATRNMKRFQGQTQATTTSVKSLLASLGLVASVALAARELIKFGRESVDAYLEQEQAVAKMNAALKITGILTPQLSKDLQDLATELQRTTMFGDETTLAATGLLQSLAKLNGEQLKQAIPLVQDLAAGMGLDLVTAASLVGKTLGSTTNALSRYGIVLDATASPAEKLAALNDQINASFGGMAEALGETFQGRMVRMKNAWGDIKEIVGKFLLESAEPVMTWLLDFITNAQNIDTITRTIKGFGAVFTTVFGILVPFLKTNINLFKIFAGVVNETWVILKTLLNPKEWGTGKIRDALKELTEQTAALAKETLDDWVNYAQKNIQRWTEVFGDGGTEVIKVLKNQYELQRDIAEETERVAQTIIVPYQGAVDVMKQLNQSYVDFKTELELAAEAQERLMAMEDERIPEVVAKLNEMNRTWEYAKILVPEVAEEIENFTHVAERVSYIMKDAFGDAFAALGQALVEGGDAWEAFGDIAKEAVAKLLDALGQEALARAAFAIGKALAGNPAALGEAAAWGAAAAAAFAGAGMVRALGEGGIVTKPTMALVGERGPEAVIPLNRAGGMGTIIVNVQGSLMEEEGLVRRITEVQKRYARGY